MITSCFGVLVKRGGLLLALTGFAPKALFAQIDSTASSTVVPLRQNAWLSVGIGPGRGGVAGVASGWFSNNHLILGVHAAGVADWDREVHDVALLVGARDLSEGGLIMIAAGPARLGGKKIMGNPYSGRTVATNEFGIAISAEAIISLPIAGLGVDAFVARSENRLVEGITLSLQVGWLGY
jgi:hypothetical protein